MHLLSTYCRAHMCWVVLINMWLCKNLTCTVALKHLFFVLVVPIRSAELFVLCDTLSTGTALLRTHQSHVVNETLLFLQIIAITSLFISYRTALSTMLYEALQRLTTNKRSKTPSLGSHWIQEYPSLYVVRKDLEGKNSIQCGPAAWCPADST